MSWVYFTPNLPPAEASHGQRNMPCEQAKSKGIVFSRFHWARKHPGGICLLAVQFIGGCDLCGLSRICPAMCEAILAALIHGSVR